MWRASASASSTATRPVRRPPTLEIDHHAERPAGRQRARREPVGHGLVVHGDDQPVGAGVEPGEAGDLGRGHHLGEEQHAGHAGVGHDLGLRQRRAALAERTGLGLQLRHRHRLVDLGDRPEPMAGLAEIGGEIGDVALQPVEVEHQRRRGQRGTRSPLADQRFVGAERSELIHDNVPFVGGRRPRRVTPADRGPIEYQGGRSGQIAAQAPRRVASRRHPGGLSRHLLARAGGGR